MGIINISEYERESARGGPYINAKNCCVKIQTIINVTIHCSVIEFWKVKCDKNS